eukprot:862278-Pyramimonas_sp.AAC.1
MTVVVGALSVKGGCRKGALTRLSWRFWQALQPYFRTYLSVSGPHLGYLYSTNKLFDSGIWVLKKLKRSRWVLRPLRTYCPHLLSTLTVHTYCPLLLALTRSAFGFPPQMFAPGHVHRLTQNGDLLSLQ